MKNYKEKIIQLTLWLAFLTTFVSGQTQKENELNRAENFAIPAVAQPAHKNFDGKTRDFEQLGLDVPVRCPLTLILYCNFASSSVLRYMKNPKIRKQNSEGFEKSAGKNGFLPIAAPAKYFLSVKR